ncbi:MAG: M48 family metallopeptidase [Methylococcaceae bacterium]|nr:MAG: M48 family metallopeptidase [Methylococcaceae bacterium]
MKINAFYYDGLSSSRQPVEVLFSESAEAHIHGANIDRYCSLGDLRISPRIGNTARHIYLNGGGQLETADNDAVDALARGFEHGKAHRLAHRLEKSWPVALAALLLAALAIWAGIEYGVPATARWAAANMPESVRVKIGAESLATLDKVWLHASALDGGVQQRLRGRLRHFTAALPAQPVYRLEFRDSGALGANAFALPGRTLVVTDALVKLADSDEQIIAVLAHEIGHVEYDHGLRTLLQNSMTALMVAVALGDITSISSLAVTLPTVLVEARYSRQFEWEADRYALTVLKAEHIPVRFYAEILEHLQRSNQDSSAADYFSSHPDLQQRIDRIREQQ